MNSCNAFESQLLDHLYGLLDDADQRALASHLESCPACQASLARAQEQRGLLASAAKREFAEVRFVPPAAETVVLPLEAAPPIERARRPWLRWAAAASLLLALLGLGGWEGVRWYEHYDQLVEARESYQLAVAARDRFHSRRGDLRERLEGEIQAIQAQIRLLEAKWSTHVEQRKKEFAAQDMEVIITGPKSVQAGALNTYQVETRSMSEKLRGDAAGKRLPALVKAELLDPQSKKLVVDPATQKPLFAQEIESVGVCQLQLPADLPVKPGTEWTLQVTAQSRDGKEAQVSGQLALTAPLYLTHLMTDRPMYRPGDTVHFRSLTLERFSLKPAAADFHLRYSITNAKNEELFKLDGPARVKEEGTKTAAPGPDDQPLRGIGAGDFHIPDGLAGGEYTLLVSESQNRFAPQKRSFLINNYPIPRLNKELEFTRKSFGPGDLVEVNARVSRVEGGKAIAGERVTATASVDGKRLDVELEGEHLKDAGQEFVGTRADGSVTIKFRLPGVIEAGSGSLAVAFKDGGTHETIVRPIPIVLKKLLVEFFPEGGDLVAGVTNRVYFQARTTLDKPAELRGRIVDQLGNHVVNLETLSDDKEPGVNQGMGRCEFTPRLGASYELKIDAPLAVEGRFPLPDVKPDGVVLSLPQPVIDDKIDVVLHSAKQARKLLVGAYCRGRLLDHATVSVKPGEPRTLALKPATGVSGVYRVTVFEERNPGQFTPVAERLTYRRSVERVDFKLTFDKDIYAPGDKVKLGIKAHNERQEPTPVIAVVSVVDQSILKLADEKTARSMPTHFLLSTEVRHPEELEYADFLVSPHPKAVQALDLLLGTQGWRRFAEQLDQKDLREQKKQDAERLLVAFACTAPLENNLVEREIEKIDSDYFLKYQDLQQNLGQREETFDERNHFAEAERREVERHIAETQTAYRAADERLAEFLDHMRLVGLLTLAVVLSVLGVAAFVTAVRRQAQELPATGWYATAICSCVFLILGGLFVLVLGPFHALRPEMAAQRQAGVVAMKEQAKLAEDPFFGGDPRANEVPMARLEKDAAKKDERMPKAPPPQPVPPREPGVQPAPPLPQPPQLDAAKLPGQDEKDGKDVLAKAREKVLDDALRLLKEENKGAEGARMNFLMQQNGQVMPGFHDMERELRKQRRWHDLAELRLNLEKNRLSQLPVQGQPLVVRQYAHERRPGSDNIRRDFTETLCWHPVLVVPGGRGAEVAFDLNDSVTRFQVQVWGHTLDGRLGAQTAEIASRLPFSVEPKVPIEISSRDQVTIPVTVANDTNKSRSVELRVDAEGLNVIGAKVKQLAVDADKRVRQLFQFQPSLVEGDVKLRFFGSCVPLGSDSVERTFKVVPDGFPVVASKSDLLEKVAEHVVTFPEKREHWLAGTLNLQVQVFPSTLADLQKGLESLLREPCGCFEQSSTSNYPNVLIVNYLKESDQPRPEVEKRARQLMTSGYQKLTSFECVEPSAAGKRKGYEWFGGAAPPHEALTAYGLLQFVDMGKVHPVDAAMLERTRKYLLDQRDRKGGFARNTRALDTFGSAPEHITNAYIVWALTESGAPDNLDTELKALFSQAKGSKDSYFVALVGNSLLNRGQAAQALELLQALRGEQKADGHLDGATTSITGSGGRDLEIETTALAVLAWLKANRPADFNEPVQKAVQWIGKQRGGYGGFGATQSTILALKALIAHTKANKKTAEAGELRLFVNDRAAPAAVTKFAAGAEDTLLVKLPDEKLLKPGDNKVRVEITGNNQFPHTLSWSYQALKPANAENCPVHLTAQLDRAEAGEGETVKLTATVKNESGKGQGMAVAILGLPGGLTIPEDMKQLKELAQLQGNGTKPGTISAFEIRGRELVLYWRDLAPEQTITVHLDLICRVPGQYRGPASRAYLYYNSDRRFWIEPLSLTITPKAE